jgi:ribosome production factor 1
MAKKKNAKSNGSNPILGKKPSNRVKHPIPSSSSSARVICKNPSHIRNKLKRSEMYGKYLMEKSAKKKEERKKRERNAQALGEDTIEGVRQSVGGGVVPPPTKTLDNTREWEATMVTANDEQEVEADHQDDEFHPYFQDTIRPKILITTRPKPSQQVFFFIADLQNLIPSLHYYPRQSFSLKEICQFATNRDFTHLIVLGERHKQCNGMTISHLRRNNNNNNHDHDNDNDTNAESSTSLLFTTAGPTAFFKVSNVVTSQRIPKHGTPTSHIPELNLHGFVTRLGQRVGRFLGSIFPHNAEFQGRQVVTFHNQRDFIFVRHHRYVFYDSHSTDTKTTNSTKTRARLQELGPRFTLKLKWLQEGTFDTQFGEYEWLHKRKEMDITRRRFHL